MEYDLILKGGRVIDPASALDAQRDIAVGDGKIALVEEHISAKARKIVDVSDLVIVPGLLDCHCHIYPCFPQEADRLYNINADAHMLQAGVTTAIDAGTCGWRDFQHFKEQVIDCSEVRVLAMINIAAGGMVRMQSEQTLSEFHPGVVAEIAKAYSDVVVAIKTAHYWTHRPFTEAHPPWASVDATLKAGELSGKPCMFDFFPWLPERPYEGLLSRMRPGDMHTHMYAQQFPVLDQEGRVNDCILKARRRGVRFDLGHGAGSFWFRNAVPAFQQGFGPDTLSSDLYMENIHGSALNVLNIMSKYMCIGMTLEEVIARATCIPARQFGHAELGTLSVGSCADIAVLRVHEGKYAYTDCGHARLDGKWKLECAMTVREGRIVYDPSGMSMPLWTEAPERYWVSPGVI